MFATLVLCLTTLLAAPAGPSAIRHRPSAAAPPRGIAGSDWRQLTTAEDDSPRLDEGALYALLRSMMQRDLSQTAGEAGATVPDYQAMLDHPAPSRGRRFLLEGTFAGRPLPMTLLRSGPWGDKLTQWGLMVKGPDGSDADVVLVYILDPAGRIARPRKGQPLRLTGRFYKVWRTRDLNNDPTRLLVFVARPAPGVVAHSRQHADGHAPGMTFRKGGTLALILLLVAAALVGWRVLKAKTKPGPTAVHQRRADRIDRERREDARGWADQSWPKPDDPLSLPEDPAEAMAELRRHHDEGKA